MKPQYKSFEEKRPRGMNAKWHDSESDSTLLYMPWAMIELSYKTKTPDLIGGQFDGWP
jgi:hypothetical protein